MVKSNQKQMKSLNKNDEMGKYGEMRVKADALIFHYEILLIIQPIIYTEDQYRL